MKLSANLILASRSPRRRILLRQLGLSFSVVPGSTEETIPRGTKPAEIVQRLAFEKARAVSRRRLDALVLGADTIVVHQGRVLGKPATTAAAESMLRRLSGATHQVFTGLALLHEASERRVTAVESTEVTMARLTHKEIASYVATGAPMDKAGGYGIQDDMGAVFVSGISGDYYTVVGLPLRRLYVLLKQHFADMLTE